MSDAAPPTWVRKLELPSGQWRCLVGLWGFARYDVEGPAKVWPSRVKLADATGQTAHAVAKQLRKLAALGWIRRTDASTSTVFELAWITPWTPQGSTRTLQDSDPTGFDSDPTGLSSDPTGFDTRTPQGPLTFQGTSNQLPTNVAERATSPARSMSPNEASPGDLTEPEWGAQLADVCEAARVQWLNSSAVAWSWSTMANERRLALKLTWAHMLDVCRVWELAPAGGDTPPIDELWQRKHGAWVAKAAGIERARDKAPLDDAYTDEDEARLARMLARPSPPLRAVGGGS